MFASISTDEPGKTEQSCGFYATITLHLSHQRSHKPLIRKDRRLFVCPFPAWCCTKVLHMAGLFLTKSRHGSIYYFRRRVPQAAQQHIGRRVLVHSLETSDRRAAVIRSRALATQTDAIFQRIAMATKSDSSEGFTFNYEMRIDFHESGAPSSLIVNADPHEEEAVNSAIRTALGVCAAEN